MRRSRLSTDERALSPVIGTVLMVGITVTLMAMVGAVVLQGTPAEANSEMEIVTQEEHSNGNTVLHIGVASGEGELDLLTGNGGDCDWDGPKDVEMGDNESLTCSDLPEDESVAVIHDGSQSEIIDEYTFEGPPSGAGSSGELEIQIIEYDDEVSEGESASILVEVENEGNEGIETVELVSQNHKSGSPTAVDTEDITISDEPKTVEFDWTPPEQDNEQHFPVNVHINDENTQSHVIEVVDGEDGDDEGPIDPSPEFAELTATVSDIDERGSGDPIPDVIQFDYELTESAGDVDIEFTADVDGATAESTTNDYEGIVEVNSDAHPNDHDYQTEVTANVNGNVICEETIYDGQESVDLC